MTDIIQTIDKQVSEENYSSAVQNCAQNGYFYLGTLISEIVGKPELYNHLRVSQPILLKVYTNWLPSHEQTIKYFDLFSKGNCTWNNVCLVDKNPDYWVIINRPPPNASYDPKKTIVFRMEPNMERRVDLWGDYWADPPESDFLYVQKHAYALNNLEWHLARTFNQLVSLPIVKSIDRLSTVLSAKYNDPGHKKRVDFVKFLESQDIPVDVFGSNAFNYRSFAGALPYRRKDAALITRKYTFNAENCAIPGYVTEKLIDGILCECLTFYWGCPNVADFIDPRAYVQLSLDDFEKDY